MWVFYHFVALGLQWGMGRYRLVAHTDAVFIKKKSFNT